MQLILTIYVTLGLANDRYCPYTQAFSAPGSLSDDLQPFQHPMTVPKHAPHRNRHQCHWRDDFATTKGPLERLQTNRSDSDSDQDDRVDERIDEESNDIKAW